MKTYETGSMVRLVTVCSMISFFRNKNIPNSYSTKRSHVCCRCFYILIALMFLWTYIVHKASSCVTFSVFFATRASIVCIDSGTCDTIRVSLALAIRFFNISINRYTLTYDPSRHNLIEGVSKCMISREEAQAKFNEYCGTLGPHDEVLCRWIQDKRESGCSSGHQPPFPEWWDNLPLLI